MRSQPYIAVFTGKVVRNLHRLEADRFLHPKFPRVGRVGVAERLASLVLHNLTLAYRRPARVEKLVAECVRSVDAQEDSVVERWLQSTKGHQKCRKQAPRRKKT